LKTILIINPLSRSGRSKKYLSGIIRSCKELFGELDYMQASTYTSLRKLSEEANKKNVDIIVSVGGDGTINSVLNGFYDKEGKRISKSRLGVIYTGTSPDFCKSYHVPLDHGAAIDCMKSGYTRQVMPGKIRFRCLKDSSAEETRYFFCCANIGIGAGIARDANKIRKYTGDLGGTFISLLKNLLTFKRKRLFLQLDHKIDCIEKATNISIGRTPYIASGIKVNNERITDNDCFYVIIASDLSWYNFPGLLRQIYSGNIGNTKYLRFNTGKNIILNSDEKDVEVEFDGDPAGYLPCYISLAEEPIELFSPPTVEE